MKVLTYLILLPLLVLTSCISSPTSTVAPTKVVTEAVVEVDTTLTSIPTQPKPTEASTLNLFPTSTSTTEPTEMPTSTSTPEPLVNPTETPSAVTSVTSATWSLLASYSTQVGLSLAGGEFGEGPEQFPGILGEDYIYPEGDCTVINAWVDRGITIFRVPFRLERVYQDGQLRADDVAALKSVLKCAAEREARVVLDMHNYMRVIVGGEEVLIGSDLYPVNNWVEAWGMLAEELSGEPGLSGYGIMSEPWELSSPYEPMAQLVINEIRKHDMTTPIVVSGNCWSSIGPEWQGCNAALAQVTDPADFLVFDGHLFLDQDGSGYYECLTPQQCEAEAGVKKLDSFVGWCADNGVRCWVGSFGVPVTEPAWEPYVRQLLDTCLQHDIGVAFWVAGSWWGDYLMSLERPEAEWLRSLMSEY